MMQLEKGIVLECVSSDPSDYFYQSQILIVEYNKDGAIGFILNKAYDRKLSDLQAFNSAPNIQLYEGGPVQQDHLYLIQRIVKPIVGGNAVKENISFGGDLKDIIALVRQGCISTNELKMFVGYCGWDHGQLEEEINDGSWTIIELNENIIFS